MPTLEDRKNDRMLLLRTLGIPGYAGDNHLPCKWCAAELGRDKKSISVWRAPDAWAWKCHRCSRGGTIVDALAEVEGISAAEAIKRLCPREESWHTSAPRPSPFPPLTDAQRREMTLFIERCMVPVLTEQPMVCRYAKKRGLNLTTLCNYCVGFDVEERRWIFPVADVKSRVRGVKFHAEESDFKSGWVRFAPKPAKCGWTTFFPLPEAFPEGPPLAIAEGELKALALLSGGLAATAPVTGAGFAWPEHQARRFRGRDIIVVYDDDEPGRAFRDRTAKALHGIARKVSSYSYGGRSGEAVTIQIKDKAGRLEA